MSKPQQTFSQADILSAGATLCYIYTLHASNDPEKRPRYVGFTCKPKRRESEHNRGKENGRKGEWVRGLKAMGERVIITLVHSFRSDDLSERATIEDIWIGSFQKKYPDLLNDNNGGVGVAKPSDRFRKNRSNAMKRRYSDPAERKLQSEIQKRRYAENPLAAKKHSEMMKLHYANPVSRKKTGEASKHSWKSNHGRRKLTSEAAKLFWADPENRQRMVEERKRRFKDPILRKRMSEMAKKYWMDKKLNEY